MSPVTPTKASASNMNDQHAINILKGLVIDAVNKSQSGHPGGPMSSMDLTYILFTEYLNFNPDDSEWLGRDRFILSAGHMSMLQYVMLYCTGWLTMDDLKNFRQLHSKTPGHPENFMTPGVECTTGPLGQGAAMSVGFAIAAQHLAAKLHASLFNHKVYALVSDGDLQEGVALGSASLAGHLKLNNLVWIYDKNDVQLSGPTADTNSDEEEQIYTGFGWRVLTIDGHDHKAIRQAYDQAQQSDRPTLIVARTVIGKGCHSLENSYKTHGSPLPADERAATKQKMGLPEEEFYAPAELVSHFQRNFEEKRRKAQAWQATLAKEYEQNQAFRRQFKQYFENDSFQLPEVPWPQGKAVATRNAFGDIIEQWAEHLPNLIGGSADLAPSNMTAAFAKKVGDFDASNRQGRNINFGVREFPMSAICNGIALHGGLIPFDATFLSFADYSRPALRLGAIQRVRVIHEFTHDSFYLGEDGPTHQPIEQVMSMRAIPNFYVMRPADAQETEALLRKALQLSYPSAICLTRQKLPLLDIADKHNIERGAYVIKAAEQPTHVMFATGSEVSLALEAAKLLEQKENAAVQVVSVPCWELFFEQDHAYRSSVLLTSCTKRISVEAGTTLGWERFVGTNGLIIGIDHFGASAPAEVLADEYGFTANKVYQRITQHSFT